MAKGSNNPRGRSSDASKPYDVSNSFVKRVATRVTELLPQPSSWLSRWMSPASVPNLNDFTNHALSSTITSRPPATTRADLNLVDNVDNHIPAKKPRTNRYNSPVNQNKFLRSNTYGPDDLSPIALPRGEPVAGPSSAHPEIVASTPAVHSQPQSSTKANGDDCSETSESTSGCSSLVPQAQSSTRSLGGSKYGQTFLQGANMDSLHRRKPSFSTTTFTSPLRTSMRDRVGSSPFYSGRTMYGGSSQAYLSALHSPQRRVGPTVKPLPAQQTLPLSSTAKRILDALEQFSTPVMDAKRMPVVGSKRKLESGSQRYTELSIPTTPDLLRVKRRERLQQSTSAARQAANASLASLAAQPPAAEYTVRIEDDLDRKRQTGKVKTKDKVLDEVLTEIKLPRAVLAVDKLPKIDISIPPPPPLLTVVSCQPPATSVSGKFKFSTPLVVPHSGSLDTPASPQTSSFKFSAPLSETSVNKTNVSATKSDSTEMTRTYGDSEASNPKRQKSNSGDISVETPVSLENDHSVVKTLSGSITASTGEKFSAPIQNKKTVQGERQDVKFPSSPGKFSSGHSKANSSMDKGIVSKSLQEESIDKISGLSNSKSQTKNPPNTTGFGNLYKKPVGTWECSTCLIQNKGEAIKCVACESSRPVKKDLTTDLAPVSTAAPSITVVAPLTSGFGEQFKKPLGSWECQACMVTNKSNDAKCVACETPKVDSKPSIAPKLLSTVEIKPAGSGFGNMFKKAAGSWSCDTCMVTNEADKIKCVACETIKPGATVPKSEVSTPKFSFGIPANSSEGNTTFSFGIPKDHPSATLTSSFTLSKPNEGKSDASTSSQTFTFGIPKSSKNDTDNSNESSQKPMFQFSSGSTEIKTSESKLSFAGKEPMPETNKEISSSEPLKSEQIKPSNTDSVTSTISSGVKPIVSFNAGNHSSQDKVSNNTPLFTFGANKVAQNKTVSITEAKPSQPSFMFGAKQGGYGSNMASSTTSTLSSSSPSNVFKFGETKTVSSGSHTSSISSITTQSSIPTSKATNIFSFGSKSEKKEISFGTTPPKESLASIVQTTTNENKPSFGSFSTTPSQSSAFSSSNTFANSTFGSKDQTPNHFAPQTTSHVFGTAEVTNAPPSSTFSGFAQSNAFQTTTQENKPSPIFNFGSAPIKEPQTTGGFVFNPVSEKRADTTFGFAAQANTSAPSFGFNNTSTVPSSSFNFEPKPFGSGITSFNATSDAPGQIFGAPVAQQPTPAFGEQSNPNPVFAFGTQSAQPSQAPSNSIFEFGTNQQQQNTPVAPAPSTTFSFGAAPSPASTALPTPAFDPNIKPTFNFSQGGTPVFSAVPTANSGSTTQPQNRKIRKAVRRSNISSVRQT